MSATASVAHRIPGRLRLSIPDRRGDEQYFADLAGRFAGHPAVQRARPNARAGSMVLEHAGEADSILEWVASTELLAIAPAAGAAGTGSLAEPAPPVRLVSGRTIDPTFMAGVAFLGLGLVQLARGQVMVPAATAFWYAISVFPQWQSAAAHVPATAGDD